MIAYCEELSELIPRSSPSFWVSRLTGVWETPELCSLLFQYYKPRHPAFLLRASLKFPRSASSAVSRLPKLGLLCDQFVHQFIAQAARARSFSPSPLHCVPCYLCSFAYAVSDRFVLTESRMLMAFIVLYALAKSIKFPAAQGRVSLRLSGVAGNNASPSVSEKEDPAQPRPRGWWDYVPDSQRKTENDPNQRAQTWNIVDDQGFIRNMRTMFGGWTGDTAAPAAFQDKESHLTTMPRDQSQQKSRRSTVRFSTRLPSDVSRMSINVRPPSPTPSKARSLSSLMDRMKPFRELMKNEVRILPLTLQPKLLKLNDIPQLAHAALITFFNVVATILGLVGAFGHSPIPQTVFVNSYCMSYRFLPRSSLLI